MAQAAEVVALEPGGPWGTPREPSRSATAGRSLVAAVLLALSSAAFAAEPKGDPGLAASVRAEFLHAWRGYKTHAWGHDELLPRSRTGHDWYGDTLLMTPVDALDTMLLMGLREEASETTAYLGANLSFDRDISVKNFEMTIRMLGGLLSAYQMSGEKRLLDLAEDLGNRLLPAFDSPTGMPYMYVNLRTGRPKGAVTNPAEIGTLLLEYGTLSRLTHREVFYDKAKRALVELHRRRSAIGLVGEEIDVETGRWVSCSSHVGGGIDSYYEYQLKCARLLGDQDCALMWKESQRALDLHVKDESQGGLWYGEVDMETGNRLSTTYGALQAFLPAVFVLAGDLDHARRLQASGYRMWSLEGIEPEELDYAAMRVTEPGYALRPEIVESAYYLYRATGDPQYLAMGKRFFRDLVQYCRTPDGYTVLRDVRTKEQGDLMPSYFLAETLKYLYLLFSPRSLDFDTVTFNTEAHPLRSVR